MGAVFSSQENTRTSTIVEGQCDVTSILKGDKVCMMFYRC